MSRSIGWIAGGWDKRDGAVAAGLMDGAATVEKIVPGLNEIAVFIGNNEVKVRASYKSL